jgi:MoxR-like ATPase
MPNSNPLRYQPVIKAMTDELPAVSKGSELDSPDRRDGSVYCYDDELHLAVELALSTGRPLLLRGDPGSGKSSLAAYIARNLGWRYYEHVVTSATQAQDLLWRYDAVRRLADAQARPNRELNDFEYVEPGILWWVFDSETARRRGAPVSAPQPKEATEPNSRLNKSRAHDRAVVLIDELDKADPDVPNALLVPLGSTRFHVDDVNIDVMRAPDRAATREQLSRLLVVITTNEERDLPSAFLRRCVVHKLIHPDAVRLVEIARRHFERPDQPFGEDDVALCRSIADQVEELRKAATAAARRPPSTAEYLDAVRACRTLHITVGPSKAWQALEKVLLRKDDDESAQ